MFKSKWVYQLLSPDESAMMLNCRIWEVDIRKSIDMKIFKEVYH